MERPSNGALGRLAPSAAGDYRQRRSGRGRPADDLWDHVVGLWLDVESADLTAGQRGATWLAVMIPYTLWIAVVWRLPADHALTDAAAGELSAVIIGAPLLLLSKRVGQVLNAMPASWLIAFQLYRVHGSWAVAAASLGTPPIVFGVPAGIGDVQTGLFAVPAAIAAATGTAQGRSATIAWNILGLADFPVAVTLGAITLPRPFQLIVPDDVPSIGAGVYLDVLTPAFAVPSSILLHAFGPLIRVRTNCRLAVYQCLVALI